MTATEFDVPADFPLLGVHAAIAGHQPKLALVNYNGRFYAPGGTPPELLSRWDICEDLAQQFAVKSRECKAGKRSHRPEVEIPDKFCVRAMKMRWCSDDEMRWVIRRAAALLDCPVPASAAVVASSPRTD